MERKRLMLMRMVVLFVLISVCGISRMQAIDKYVYNGTANGNGDDTATPYTLAQFITYLASNNVSYSETEDDKTDVSVFFAAGTYNVSSPIVLRNNTDVRGLTVTFDVDQEKPGQVIFDGGGGNRRFFNTSRNGTDELRITVEMKNLTIRNYNSTTAANTLLVTGTYTTLDLDHVIIDNCRNAGYMINFNANYVNLNVAHSTIRNCQYSTLFYVENNTAEFMFNGNSVYNNTFTSYLIDLNNYYMATIINNTFAKNTLTHGTQTTRSIHIDAHRTRIVNNILYNSGSLYFEYPNSTTTWMYNNIVVTTENSAISGTVPQNVRNHMRRNILGDSQGIYYCPADITRSAANLISSTTYSASIASDLTTDPDPGKQVLEILDVNNPQHIILGRGGPLAYLYGETGLPEGSMAVDQRENGRPLSAISLGPVDFAKEFAVDADRIHVTVNSNTSVTPVIPLPQTVTVDLADYVTVYPYGATPATTAFKLLNADGVEETSLTLLNGTLSLSGSLLTFSTNLYYGDLSVLTGTSFFKFRVRWNGFSSDVAMSAQVTDYASPPGYIFPGSNCEIARMGEVKFTPGRRFLTRDISGSSQVEIYTIPLVGDLNGDGYPEIVSVGRRLNNNGSGLRMNSVIITNGQTGQQISQLYLPGANSGSSNYTCNGYHGSASPFALIDSDRDGVVELIVAFPSSGGSSAYRYRLASFNLVPVVSNGITTYELKERWLSQPYASSTTFDKPTPQVCDLDGDGKPEILIYNQIYDATLNARTPNGSWPASMKNVNPVLTLGGTLSASTYVGRISNALTGADAAHAYPYIFELDGDTIYDIAAGGKIYCIKKSASGVWSANTFQLPSAMDPGDGFTGVADINGDGKPDVVVVTRTGSGAAADLIITAYNPNFVNPANSEVLARTVMDLSGGGTTGSNSYVFIGDIDGRGQVNPADGKTYYLPEVAILTRRLDFGDIPKHPLVSNIPAGDGATQGGFPTSYSSSSVEGVLFAVTYDLAASSSTNRFKMSFALEHTDESINTGFTLFDFDNDGIKELCYRDETTLRIIKPKRPYVKLAYNETNQPDVILYKFNCYSGTGYEYPVIVDIDNDASAEMVVTGNESASGYRKRGGYIYAVGNGQGGDKFAPALPVWNQYMYDPFKINTDLTTPIGPPKKRIGAGLYDYDLRKGTGYIDYQPYNATLAQIPYYTIDTASVPGKYLFEPIIYLSDGYIQSAELMGAELEIIIGNRSGMKTDLSIYTPVTIYLDSIAPATRVGSTRTLIDLGVTSAIRAGQTVKVVIPVPSSVGVYYIRLGDSSTPENGTITQWHWGTNDLDEYSGPADCGPVGLAHRAYRESCENWADNFGVAAKFLLRNDYATVQEYAPVTIDVLGNDIFPDGYFDTVNLADSISIPPKAGALSYTGSGNATQVIYTHHALQPLANSIDSFQYKLSYTDPVTNDFVARTAWVYIYVLQSATGSFAACYGSNGYIALKHLPAEVRFYWFNSNHLSDGLGAHDSTVYANITADLRYYVEPRVPAKNFPQGQLDMYVVSSSLTDNAVMRWTGKLNSDWKNPVNWVEVKAQYGFPFEVPVLWAPTTCVDVSISSDALHYPELVDSVSCGNIRMEDRAMLKNPHVLDYDSASVEIILKPAERDRFIMWSAPLKNMYSGDYHFKNSSNQPQWGDVYMNLFQQANPANTAYTPQPNMFTATIGELGEPLPLGKAFNLLVTTTTRTRDVPLIFPQTYTSYTDDVPNSSYPTPRGTPGEGYRFITDGLVLGFDRTFPLNVPADSSGSYLVQVVNPYLAYLDVIDFLGSNVASFTPGVYIIWDGNVNDGFTAVKFVGDTDYKEGMRYIYSGTLASESANNPRLIPPLQSFFVQKRSNVKLSAPVKMSPNWTTTSGARPFTLRAGTDEVGGVLYIKAVQGQKTSSTALQNDPNASPAFNGNEDVRNLFFDEMPLTLYSLTAMREPLAINASGDFQSQQTDLGLRILESGETKLEFSGLNTFGHLVYLIDKEKNLVIDLQQTPEYTFTVTKPADVAAIELNDRFTLRMDIDPTANQPVASSSLLATSLNGELYVRATSGSIRSLEVYHVNGALIYSTQTESELFRVPVERGQVYVVKARIGETYEVRKVLVR
ncbi:MAG: right-handed parallel beta-helix repeat-containing protein [Tannerella sp.]|jgi:hypothetical protein|nr:right-handed parallel beta-helix repeat-containing protein [Tannerella sp.]